MMISIKCCQLLTRFLLHDATLYCYGKSSVHPSVCLSVTFIYRDHISSDTSKIISQLVSSGCSLFADPNIVGNTLKYWPK